jgi:hypothetical protein
LLGGHLGAAKPNGALSRRPSVAWSTGTSSCAEPPRKSREKPRVFKRPAAGWSAGERSTRLGSTTSLGVTVQVRSPDRESTSLGATVQVRVSDRKSTSLGATVQVRSRAREKLQSWRRRSGSLLSGELGQRHQSRKTTSERDLCPANVSAFSGERQTERSEGGRSTAATPCWTARAQQEGP